MGRFRWSTSETIVITVRFGVLTLCGVLSLLAVPSQPIWAPVLLVLIALGTSVPAKTTRIRWIRSIVEAALVAAIIGVGIPATDPLLPYVVVAPFAAGLLAGALPSTTTVLTSLFVLSATQVINDQLPARAEIGLIAEWIGLALVAGLLSAWGRSVTTRDQQTKSTYATAHHLLTELRDVARVLPTGLDEISLAQEVLRALLDELPGDRAALYTNGTGGVLTQLAHEGEGRIDWIPDLEAGCWGEAWTSGLPVQQFGMFDNPEHGHAVVFPLRLGDRPLGLIGVERQAAGWSGASLETAQGLANEAALRIDTGQLFTEVRTMATVEERRRLAREIHDGVAQEVAALGYAVDELAANASDDHSRTALMGLRAELSRIVNELRLSIFDLRSDVQPTRGLGSALSGYLRSVGTDSGLTVHLVLDEAAFRLPIDVETELLRIAQEAITNARKHARARNLWVTCRIDPPKAFLRIADDGAGLGSPRADSYGIDIMRERSDRLGANMSLRARVGGGTVVEVSLSDSVVIGG